MIRPAAKSHCPGCGVDLESFDGPTHAYMTSSPACFELFTNVLAFEYSDAALLATHRLTVDTYAVQHPGTGGSRRQIQSVGLHLVRLCVQLASPLPPKETNDVMLGCARHKQTFVFLEPPDRFSMTVVDVAPYAGGTKHAGKVREWAARTWNDWAKHHSYIHGWIEKYMPEISPDKSFSASTNR